ncbi:superfamily I DNA/RNA helicase/mRNA-degrading endonuclease RelE of RelBE toxin-antitoxin system [Deinobacterium chartae]|uniref:DNA 3'-5' helicase n=1 Tax=Deinobacterium chartae TaxID=521158 RepID=A0A841I0N6_9DEIO|nr:3'-5' exonuclease [Deinobacterium chartae]MBB6099351.1 superfamily I DNA/RNA helicase/mRNA-degrading endonuclease RelE of RelBE toxin-antitoxin system [Deinobacterium chartae]
MIPTSSAPPISGIEQTVTPTFMHELGALPKRTHDRVEKALAVLKRDPTNAERQLDIKKLQQVDAWRIKIDDYRVLYQFDDRVMTFISVLPRKDVYKKLGIPDEDGLTVVPDVTLKPVVPPQPDGLLPHPLTLELLEVWRIRGEDAHALAACRTEDDLLEASVPYPVFSKVVDLLYSKKWQERLAQPSYVLAKPTDLEDLVEGRLTTKLLRLDDHQRHLSALGLEDARAPIVVKGGPGSGKSTVALYRAKLLVERFPDASVAYTTYTNALVEASKEQLAVLLPDDPHAVRVSTVDSLAKQMLETVEPIGTILGATDPLTLQIFEEVAVHKPPQLRKFSARYLLSEFFDVIELTGLDSEDAYLASPRAGRKAPLSAAHRKLIWRLYQNFHATVTAAKAVTWATLRKRTLDAYQQGHLKPSFDYLLIDEAQDLSPITLRMLASIVKTPGGLYITADANQTLYESSFTWDALKEGWPQAQVHVLERNYRNTAEVVRALADIRESLAMEDSEAALTESLANGPKPRVVTTSREREVERLVEEIREASRLHKEPQRNVAILVAGTQHQARDAGIELARALKAHKLKANYMSSSGLRLDADCIKILSLYTSKGLEFPIVILWNVVDGVMPRNVSELPSEEQTEEQLKDRRLFYVGCSRAMRHLAVFTREGEESELLYELQSDHWDFINTHTGKEPA